MSVPDAIRSRLSARLAGIILGTAAITVLAWPLLEVPPATGLDASFQAGLEMAGAAGLDAGTQIVSTYGPLAFLSFVQPVYGPTSALAVLHAIAIVVALVGIMVFRGAAAFPLPVALLIAYLGAQAIKWLGVPEMSLALVAIVALLALERVGDGRAIPTWALLAAGVAVTILGFGKLNTGVAILGVAAVTVAAIGGWRRLLVFGGAALASAVVVWVLTGQGISNVIPFITSSIAMIVGYNSAMGADGDPSLHWMFGAAAIGIAAVATAASEPTRAWPMRLRIGAVLVAVIVAVITLKGSFVRWHYQFIFATLVILAVALVAPRIPRRTALLAIGVTLVALLAAVRYDVVTYLDPTPRAAVAQLRTLFDNQAAATETRDALAGGHAVSTSMLERMRGASVHIGPLETSVAFAYPDLVWRPLPVFQDYMAYTPLLDDLNRDFLEGEEGPQYILRRAPVAIDGRYPWFEGPATIRAMLCRYREVEIGDPWQVLERDVDRCGEPRLLSRAEARPGSVVDVPPLPDGDAMLFVRIAGLQPSLADAAWSFVFKGDEWYVTRDGADRFRLVPGTTEQGLVMALADDLAYSEAYGVGNPWRTIKVTPGLRSEVGAVELEMEFWTVPMEAEATP